MWTKEEDTQKQQINCRKYFICMKTEFWETYTSLQAISRSLPLKGSLGFWSPAWKSAEDSLKPSSSQWNLQNQTQLLHHTHNGFDLFCFLQNKELRVITCDVTITLTVIWHIMAKTWRTRTYFSSLWKTFRPAGLYINSQRFLWRQELRFLHTVAGHNDQFVTNLIRYIILPEQSFLVRQNHYQTPNSG